MRYFGLACSALVLLASCTKNSGMDGGDIATLDAVTDQPNARDSASDARDDRAAIDVPDALDAAPSMDASGDARDASDEADASERDARTDAAVDGDDASDGAVADVGPSVRLRLMAANLTAGNLQNYNPPPGDTPPGPGLRIMQGAHPDIVMVQEMRYGADDAVAMQGFAELIVGVGAHVCREVIDGPGDLPNGIVSRYPIVACGEWNDSRVSNRDYAYARIDVPGPRDLWAISVHLHTTTSSRPIEGGELRDNIRAHVPAGDYVVLGGDLNTDTNMESVFMVLNEVLVVQPQPSDQHGNQGTNANRYVVLADGGVDTSRAKPYDWVIPSANLLAHQRPVVLTDGVVTLTLPNGLVIDTRVFDASTIGLIAPARATDSAASNMQHMGVIRDFEIPTS